MGLDLYLYLAPKDPSIRKKNKQSKILRRVFTWGKEYVLHDLFMRSCDNHIHSYFKLRRLPIYRLVGIQKELEEILLDGTQYHQMVKAKRHYGPDEYPIEMFKEDIERVKENIEDLIEDYQLLDETHEMYYDYSP